MRPTFLLIVGSDAAGWPERVRGIADRCGLAPSSVGFPLALLTGPGCGAFVLGQSGAIAGTLFHRHGAARPVAVLDEQDRAALAAEGSLRLLRAFWGGYVAAFVRGSSVIATRDPSGALPCYMASAGACQLLASDVGILIDAGGLEPAIDEAALARHLFGGGLPQPETVLARVVELLPGFSVELPGDLRRQSVSWSPWDHVGVPGGADEIVDPERLRRIVRQAVQGWASTADRPLLSLSGGLDSSIVAACLATAEGLTCLNLHDDDPVGDERLYARLVCERLGLRLVERPFRLEDVDIEAPLSAHLPRPFGFSHALAYERAHEEVARELSCDAFVTGNGGDNVFGHSQSAAPIADRWLREGWSTAAWRTLRHVCRQTGCSAGQAARAALRLLRAPPGYRWRGEATFLQADVLERLAGEELHHPWLEAPPGALPGKAAHIASLLRVQRNLEPPRSRLAPVLNPLLSQPVMEACLAIPSWEWRAGGFDRAVARQAFAKDLPERIVRRRTKGSPDPFAARLLEHHRDYIRERLLSGRLAASGLIDRERIQAALGGAAIPVGDRMRILELLPVEAWLDAWSCRRRAVSR
ncbi:asparagine synthase C-terminal domain-containing protein [Sphingosinicella terrae]|uniref:asparagine synthase-related protein n=1 Tax=Sphingosinicella terrae TaxID=2172047 RepID=UPI000E0D5ACA|nr:asparagine synthase C-terminal domain-containing protein [Sphingosinicella terrae]